MREQNHVEVINREGWHNTYPIEKKFVYIGTDPRNDIVLSNTYGSGIQPRHLQVIWGLGNNGYRLVNLANSEIPLSGVAESAVLLPLAFADITDKTEIKLGDFRLIFHRRGEMTTHETAHEPDGPIAIRLILPETELKGDTPIMGTLLVRHLGEEPGVQFKLEVEGLPSECYELGAAPFLFPYGEEEVPLTLRHSRKPEPKGGEHRLTIRATAPEAYPGKSAKASQIIWIAPFFDFSLSLEQRG